MVMSTSFPAFNSVAPLGVTLGGREAATAGSDRSPPLSPLQAENTPKTVG
jgi:hypothetical protein